MIRSDAELAEFREELRTHELRLVEYRGELARRELAEADIERALVPVHAHIQKLQREISAYVRLKGGELPSFVGAEQLGEALVAARLAIGLSQRELAARLGVNESLVSRDEKAAYAGVTAERCAKVLRALGLTVRCTLVRPAAREIALG